MLCVNTFLSHVHADLLRNSFVVEHVACLGAELLALEFDLDRLDPVLAVPYEVLVIHRLLASALRGLLRLV